MAALEYGQSIEISPQDSTIMLRHLPTMLVFGVGLLVPSAVQAQAVQLPTFNQFSTNSSVLVPDRGSAFIGGVGRSYSGRNERGLPGLSVPYINRLGGNRAISYGTSAGGISVHAQIHDFAAMEKALLQEATMRADRAAGPRRETVPSRDLPNAVDSTRASGAGSSRPNFSRLYSAK